MKTLTTLLMLLFATSCLFAQKIPFQGKLSAADTLVNTTVTLNFSLDGTDWSEEHTGVMVTDGFYSVVLGSMEPIPNNIYNQEGEAMLYLSVDGNSLDPITLYAPIVGDLGEGSSNVNHENGVMAVSIMPNKIQLDSDDGSKKAQLEIDSNGNGGLAVYDHQGRNKAWLYAYGTDSVNTGGLLSMYGTESGAWVGTGFKVWEPTNLPFFHLEGYQIPHHPIVNLEITDVQDNTGGVIGEGGSLRLSSSFEGSDAGLSMNIIADGTDRATGEMFLWGQNTPNIQMMGKTWENSNYGLLQVYGETGDGNGWYRSLVTMEAVYDDYMDLDQGMIHVNNTSNDRHTYIDSHGIWHRSEQGNGVGMYLKDWDNNLPILQLEATPGHDDPNVFMAEVVMDDENRQAGNLHIRDVDSNYSSTFNHRSLTINNHQNGYFTGIGYNDFIIGKESYGDIAWLGTVNDSTNSYGQLVLRHTNGAELALDVYTDFSLVSSDRRYKSNITPLTSSLENVMKLQGVSYLYKADEFPKKGFDKDVQIGLIAQEVEQIFPELVETDDKGYKSVHYAQTVAVLIEALKELNQKVETLEAENQSLKASVEKANQNEADLKAMKLQLEVLSKIITSSSK
ncbi:tail fiber domain-containing protein [Flammeovirga sp. SubArs3]|uniref:tail fiber domain-containing protein n=1 Tax=Flammeovirga sp. SubArs3 TaxID=2995316 RepID=UPI00248AAE43|nr:tail fiber domain-containing protein [Flammeovirga sp. SubArs3]